MEPTYKCGRCQDTGWVEIMGDGPNFEYDVIDVKPCRSCYLGQAVAEEIGDDKSYRPLGEREEITKTALKHLLNDDYSHDCHLSPDDGCDHPSHPDHDPAFESIEDEEAERKAMKDEEFIRRVDH